MYRRVPHSHLSRATPNSGPCFAWHCWCSLDMQPPCINNAAVTRSIHRYSKDTYQGHWTLAWGSLWWYLWTGEVIGEYSTATTMWGGWRCTRASLSRAGMWAQPFGWLDILHTINYGLWHGLCIIASICNAPELCSQPRAAYLAYISLQKILWITGFCDLNMCFQHVILMKI